MTTVKTKTITTCGRKNVSTCIQDLSSSLPPSFLPPCFSYSFLCSSPPTPPLSLSLSLSRAPSFPPSGNTFHAKSCSPPLTTSEQKEEEQDEAKENLNLPSPNIVQETDTDRQQIPVPDPVHVEDGKQQAPPPQPPRLENPDQGYDDYNNNKEEGREADEGEGGEKDAAYDYDDNAQKQFEADMNYDRRLHARQEKEVEGIDEVMRQRISEREMRKRQQVEGLEQQQQMEVEKK